MQQNPWTPEDDANLLSAVARNVSVRNYAPRVGRSREAVADRLRLLRRMGGGEMPSFDWSPRARAAFTVLDRAGYTNARIAAYLHTIPMVVYRYRQRLARAVLGSDELTGLVPAASWIKSAPRRCIIFHVAMQSEHAGHRLCIACTQHAGRVSSYQLDKHVALP